MIYETQRLYTRQMTPDDLPALAAILQDPVAMAAYEGAFDEKETRHWLENQLVRYRRDGFGLWAVILGETGEMIGQCGLTWQEFAGTQVLEIGYHLRRDCWHQGYAIEAARGAKEYAFSALGTREIASIIRDTNLASMNVAIRNGMTVRGRAVKHYRGVDMPHYLFAVTRREYEKERAQ